MTLHRTVFYKPLKLLDLPCLYYKQAAWGQNGVVRLCQRATQIRAIKYAVSISFESVTIIKHADCDSDTHESSHGVYQTPLATSSSLPLLLTGSLTLLEGRMNSLEAGCQKPIPIRAIKYAASISFESLTIIIHAENDSDTNDNKPLQLLDLSCLYYYAWWQAGRMESLDSAKGQLIN